MKKIVLYRTAEGVLVTKQLHPLQPAPVGAVVWTSEDDNEVPTQEELVEFLNLHQAPPSLSTKIQTFLARQTPEVRAEFSNKMTLVWKAIKEEDLQAAKTVIQEAEFASEFAEIQAGLVACWD